MESNINSILGEKDIQINSMKNVINIVNNFFDESKPDDDNNKLKVKHRRSQYYK